MNNPATPDSAPHVPHIPLGQVVATPAVLALLERHRVARVGADPPRAGIDAIPAGDPGWRYWRWHGAPRVYYSDYPEQRLRALAAEVAGSAGGERWVIFDNTAHGHAIANAARLQALIEEGPG